MHTRYVLVAALLLPMAARHGLAQDHINLSGTAFGDYYYVLESADEDERDLNGFTFRRLYLTTDFKLSDRFDGRARLEAGEGSTTASGMQAFVKDLYLRWRSEKGHQARIGVVPTPIWDVSEDVWRYRSLEETIMDLNGIASSRDMGVRVDGPLLEGGHLNYHLMAGNNRGVRPEVDKAKRLYAQLSSRPGSGLVFTLGGDYAGYTDERDNHVTVSAFGAYSSQGFALGVEPFWQRTEFEEGQETTASGISLFVHGTVSGPWRLVGRIDRVRMEDVDEDVSHSTFGLIAVNYQAVRNVRLMPNLWVQKIDGEDKARVLGRFTFEFSF